MDISEIGYGYLIEYLDILDISDSKICQFCLLTKNIRVKVTIMTCTFKLLTPERQSQLHFLN